MDFVHPGLTEFYIKELRKIETEFCSNCYTFVFNSCTQFTSCFRTCIIIDKIFTSFRLEFFSFVSPFNEVLLGLGHTLMEHLPFTKSR